MADMTESNTPETSKPNLDNLQIIGRALDFVEEYGFDPEMFYDVVRKPDTVPQRDPRALEVGYNIYRFRRGDITVVVGFMDMNAPAVMFVHLHTPEENEMHISYRHTGSAGEGGKAPTTIRAIQHWLKTEGCALEFSTSTAQRVTWNGIYVASLHLTPHNSGRALKNTYMSLRRKLDKIKTRAQIEASLNKNKES